MNHTSPSLWQKRLWLFLVFAGFCVAGIAVLRVWDAENYKSHPLPQVQCIAYNPFYHFHQFNYRNTNQRVRPEWIEQDLATISTMSKCVRVYTMLYGNDIIPAIAKRYGISVIAGAEVDDDPDVTQQDIAKLIDVANNNSNVTKVIVGNEVLLQVLLKTRGTMLKQEDLYPMLELVRSKVKQPVSTAEVYFVWDQNRELAKHVDFIVAHIFPYWRGVDHSEAVSWTFETYRDIKKVFPDKEIMIAEVGWPSDGMTMHEASPGRWNAYYFLSSVFPELDKENIPYVVGEAFDQPWKQQFQEGPVGGHWGVFSTRGTYKYEDPKVMLGSDIYLIHEEIAALVLALVLFLLWCDPTAPINAWTWGIAPIMACLTGYFFVRVISIMIDEYVYLNILPMLALVPGGILLFINFVYKMRSFLDVMGNKPLARQFELAPPPYSNSAAFVSIHIPCRNEQPENVIACVESLLRQDYEEYEIIVIDNNTTEYALWKPIELFCNQHKDRVKFIHVEQLSGFKAGALRLALEHTSPKATVIGIVDSDYVVEPNWLRECTRYLINNVGAVQAPQDYRDHERTIFSRSIYDEYAGFFKIGMVQRNERNAIVQHGTMLLLSREALENSGGWHTDSIVEDTDLGVRLLIHGYECVYINHSYGRGLLPTHFNEYKKQRFRWAYGATRTLIKYAGYFFNPFNTKLTSKQKLHFVLGWLPWLSNIFHPALLVLSIILSAIVVVNQGKIYINDWYALTAVLFIPILAYAAIDFIILFFLYARRLTLSPKRTFLSVVAGASLVWTIAHGVATACIHSRYPFKVTQKGSSQTQRSAGKIFMGFLVSIPFIFSLIAFGFAVLFLYHIREITPDLGLWGFLLLVVSFPGISAGIMIVFEWLSMLNRPSVAQLVQMFVLFIVRWVRKQKRFSYAAKYFIYLILTTYCLTALAVFVTYCLYNGYVFDISLIPEHLKRHIGLYNPFLGNQADMMLTLLVAAFCTFSTGSIITGSFYFILFYASNLYKIYSQGLQLNHADYYFLYQILVEDLSLWMLLGLVAITMITLLYGVKTILPKTRLIIVLSIGMLGLYAVQEPKVTSSFIDDMGWMNDDDGYRKPNHHPEFRVWLHGPLMSIVIDELQPVLALPTHVTKSVKLKAKLPKSKQPHKVLSKPVFSEKNA